MIINYHGRKFTGISNAAHGQVSGDTVFHYSQHDFILTATYNGGDIHEGYLLGRVNQDSSLDFAYHHLDIHGKLKSGYCHSIPELLQDGRIRLHESWYWTYGGDGKGESVIEEILNQKK